ncbi:arylsulfatase [Xylariomycetidae sp. FL0641]|nr:arylsulfatase [Xylariomycetidae sp. FL0641]
MGSVFLAHAWQSPSSRPRASKQPNIVVILTDDQDYKLGSLDSQPTVQRELMGKGITLDKHFVTTGQCCPSRTSYLRGQHAHNTNVTNVRPPGDEKFVASQQDQNYLPHFLKAACYRTEYLGKFMNGYSMANYNPAPAGWDHADILVTPYVYTANNVVMSKNGERPVWYDGYHQTDVLRAKTIERLKHLATQDDPFYIQIAPAAPHVEGFLPPMPCERHLWTYNNLTAPRLPNFNPADEFQSQKPAYLKDSPYLNQSQIDYVDFAYKSRRQALIAVDEFVSDVLQTLEDQGILDNTYIIYTADNGYHLGNHRRIGGKGLPYIEDTNVPMIIRGPGVPEGVLSTVPSTHVDMAPTYLDIAGVQPEDFPEFLDGRSLLPELQNGGKELSNTWNGSEVAREVLNIEFWGTINQEGGEYTTTEANNSYKTLRIVDEESSWLFSRWCWNNETELYNTTADPYELTNLAINPDAATQRVLDRMNGILLYTKSCSAASCRNIWQTMAADAGIDADFSTFRAALDPAHDAFFAALPPVGFQKCMQFQSVENEGPYYPPASADLGGAYRAPAEGFETYASGNQTRTPSNDGRQGTLAQRHADIATIMQTARNVTDAEIGDTIVCSPPDYLPCLG